VNHIAMQFEGEGKGSNPRWLLWAVYDTLNTRCSKPQGSKPVFILVLFDAGEQAEYSPLYSGTSSPSPSNRLSTL